MKKTIFVALIAAFRLASADPVVLEPGYTISRVASGLVSATGMAISPAGDIFLTDYRDVGPSSVLRVDGTTYAVQTYATGFSFSADLAFDASGRLFVLSGDGTPRDIYQVFPDGSKRLYLSGFSFSVGLEPTSDGGLLVGNSGDGTISKISSTGVTSTFISGFGGPHGPFGLALDSAGQLYFVEHGTGRVYMSTPDKVVALLASLTPFGPTYLDVSTSGAVYVSDSQSASIHKIEGGIVTTFATGFTGKSNPPMIGPGDLAFDSFGNLFVADADSLWKISPSDTTPPVLSVPASITVDATSPAGATVNYTVTATDNSGVPPTVSCFPLSGVTFTIGTTTVNCTATDAANNSATGSFTVTVNGAATQLQELISIVGNYTNPWGITNSLDTKLRHAINALDAMKANSVGVACNSLNAFANEAQAQSGNNLTVAGAIQLIEGANRIRAVLGCPYP